MLYLVLVGLLSGLFFSSTFIINRLMSLGGGHWVWSASLRYAFMFLFLVFLLAIFQGKKTPWIVFKLFIRNWMFWIISGSIGFGGFYSLICFSADHAPGWVVAATWQLTIIASLFVLIGFGRSFPKKIWGFSVLIFIGVLMINTSQVSSLDIQQLLFGGFPVLVAAFCYPIGNQLVWEAKNGNRSLPDIASSHLDNPFNKIFLLTLGSVPFWIILIISIRPPPPSTDQIVNTALVALLSGILATSLFLFARNKSKKPSELAAVDATQSSEVIFALIGEILFLNAPLPNFLAFAGISLVFLGLFFFIRFQEVNQ
ncbi:MAG: multidrug resistance efflux transporter family protein [Desulforhopalus sp.]